MWINSGTTAINDINIHYFLVLKQYNIILNNNDNDNFKW